MKIQLLFILFINIIIINSQSFLPSDNDLWNSFINWKESYGIEYTEDEILSKFINYKETLFGLASIIVKNDLVDIHLEYSNDTVQSRAAEYNYMLLDVLEVEPTISYPNSDSVQYSMNEFSDMSNSEYQQFYNGGADPSLAVENPLIIAAGLSLGIVIGVSVAGAAIVGATVAGTVVAYKKYGKSKEEPIEIEMPKTPKDKRKSFIDIFNLKANRHKSITARGAPISNE